jgi:hypothetical protein
MRKFFSKSAARSKSFSKTPVTNGASRKSTVKTSTKAVKATKSATSNGASKSRLPMPPLEAGQVWQMAELNLQVGLVGKLLVHYKLAKPDAVRVANSVGGRTSVEKYLKTNKAVLIRIDQAAAAKANKM